MVSLRVELIPVIAGCVAASVKALDMIEPPAILVESPMIEVGVVVKAGLGEVAGGAAGAECLGRRQADHGVFEGRACR